MSTSLIVSDGGDLLAALGPDFAAAFDLAKAEKSPSNAQGLRHGFPAVQGLLRC